MSKFKLINNRKTFWLLFAFCINLLIYVDVYAQDCIETPEMICNSFGDVQGNLNWEWWKNADEDPSHDECKVWTARISEGNTLVTRGITNPFRHNGSGDKLSDIILSKDYLPAKGWVLVQRDFGCLVGGVNNPSFILYNRETGILRVYVYVVNSKTYNSYLMRLIYGTNQVSGLNSFALDETPSQDEFQSGTYDARKDAFVAHYVAQSSNDLGGDWIVGDFEMAYDSYLQNISGSGSRYQNHLLKVSVMGVSNNLIDAKVTGSSCSGDYNRCKEIIFSADPADLLSADDDNLLDELEKGAKGLKQVVKGGSEISKFFAEQANKEVDNMKKEFEFKFGPLFLKQQTTFSTLSDVSNDWDKISKIFKKVSGVTNALPGILSGVNTIAGILGITESGPPPVTFSQYNLSIEGSIRLEAPITNINFFAPGSPLNSTMDKTWQPYYKCPVGLGSLKNTPEINIIPFRQVVTTRETNGPGFDLPSYENFMSYKSMNDLMFSYPETGPKPTSVMVSYVVQLPKKHLTIPTAKTVRTLKFTTTTKHFNLLQYEIETGSLEIARVLYNEPGEGDDEIVLISPAVEIKNFKGSSINVPVDAKVKLSVITVFDNGHMLKKNYRYQANVLPNSGTHNMFRTPPYANYSSVISSFTKETVLENEEFAGLGGGDLANQCLPESPILIKQEGPQIFSRNNLELNDVVIHEQGPYAIQGDRCFGHLRRVKYKFGPRIDPSGPLIFETTKSIVLKDGFHAKPGSNVLIRTQQVQRELQQGNGSIIGYESPFPDCFNSNAKSARENDQTTIDEPKSIQDLRLWPNPTQQRVNILSPRNGQIQIFDFKGSLIFEKSIKEYQTNNLNTAQWETGIYLLKFRDDNNHSLNKKIVIH